MKTKNRIFLVVLFLSMGGTLSCGVMQPIPEPRNYNETEEPQQTDYATEPVSNISDSFDLSSANKIPPDGILEEIEYYGQGGRDCYDLTYPEVKIDFPPTDEELMVESMMISCGWQEDDIVTGTIIYPDGRSASKTIELEEDMSGNTFAAKLRFAPTLDDPVGTYTFIIEGDRGKVSATASFREPVGARIFFVDADTILLFGFSPEEAVTLYCYASGKFMGWQDYKVDSTGKLFLNAPTEKCNFAAIGTESGEVHSISYLAHGGTYDWVDYQIGSIRIRIHCNGMQSRVDAGDNASVAYTDGSNMRIRQAPGFSQSILDKVPEGTQLKILDGPECADGSTWWKIRTKDGQEGWMAEYQDDTYLIERLP